MPNSCDTHIFENGYLEITNVCNRSCSFCPGSSRPKGFIEPSEFLRRLEAVLPFTKNVFLHVMGEPLIHPQFATLLKIAEELSANIKITTNGDLIAEEVGEALLHSSAVKQINFSTHALENNSEWSAVEKIIDFTKKSLKIAPKRYINFRLWNSGGRDNFNSEFMHVVEEAFQVSLKVPQTRRSLKVVDQLYLNFDRRFEWPALDNEIVPDGACHGMESQFAILYTGEVTLCCLDGDGVASLGNCMTNSIHELLNGQQAQEIRACWSKKHAVTPLCKRCSFRLRFTQKM